MAPRKKTSTMKWVVKSQQPAKMAEPATEKKTSSTMQDCSLLPDYISKLQLSSSSSSSAKMVQPATKEHNGWSLLPEELLHIISEKLEDCFDVIHARSVCRPWRSTFPFPSCLLRTSYSLPAFEKLSRKSRSKSKSKSNEVCTLEKFPMFLFRVRAPALPCEYFLGGINQEDHMMLPSPLQCSVKVKIKESDPTLIKILDCQIIPLGYQYVMKGYDPNSLQTRYRAVAFLPLNKEGGVGGGGKGEFVVLISYGNDLFVLRSAEMRWMRLEKASSADCGDIVTFRGKFYAVFINGDIFVIDPYSLEWTPLMVTVPLCPQIDVGSQNDLVPCGNDELFLVETIIPRNGVLRFAKLECRVSRLDEEAGEWVVVTDLGDRVLLIGQPGNTSCSGKDIPDGCGLTGNSILFTSEIFGGAYKKYGVDTRNPEDDDLGDWRPSRDIDVTILCTSPGPVVALRVDRINP